MLAAYLFCLVAGGLLVGASAIFGGKDADLGGHGADADAGVDAHADAGADAHAGDADVSHAAGWLPFLSMQFWTFALAFFGLTGTALTLLGLASSLPTLIASLGVGIGSGTAISYILKRLRSDTVTSNVAAQDYVGRSAIVRLPISAGSPGKIRLSVKEQVIDIPATTDEAEPIAPGEEVLIIQVNEARAQVVRAVRVDASTIAPEVVEVESGGGSSTEKT